MKATLDDLLELLSNECASLCMDSPDDREFLALALMERFAISLDLPSDDEDDEDCFPDSYCEAYPDEDSDTEVDF